MERKSNSWICSLCPYGNGDACGYVSGAIGKDLIINEFVYNSFVWVVLGSFGISGVEKFAKK